MSFPQKITNGFNFNEAIAMSELCRRVYRVFEFERDREIGELYDAIYNDEWEFVHSMSDYETDGRGLILKRKDNNQFAVVFRGTIATSGGFEFTALEDNQDVRLVEYESIPGEPMPPSRDVRVYEGMLKGFEALREQLDLFFNILMAPKLDQDVLAKLLQDSPSDFVSIIKTVINGVSVKYNVSEDDRSEMFQLITSKVKELTSSFLFMKEDIYESLIKETKSYIEKAKNTEQSSRNKDFKRLRDKIEVYVTGHSRGGVLATFAVLYLQRSWELQEKNFSLKKYSIGSTKVGNQFFVNYYDKKMEGLSYRVQNLLDIAIYMPTPLVVPFPYNLSLMIPGVDYVREGDLYYAYYEHVGEAYTVVGLGNQKLNLNFGGPLNFTIPVPFPHGPDGYKEMLIEAQQEQQKRLMTFQNFFNVIFQKQRDAMLSLDQNISDIQKNVELIQKQLDQASKQR